MVNSTFLDGVSSRYAGFLSRSSAIRHADAAGKDVYAYVASVMFHCSIEDASAPLDDGSSYAARVKTALLYLFYIDEGCKAMTEEFMLPTNVQLAAAIEEKFLSGEASVFTKTDL